MRKAFLLIEVAYSVISAYCGFGNGTDGRRLFECCHEIFSGVCVISKFLREAAKSAADIDDEQTTRTS